MKTIKFTDYELVIILDSLEKSEAVYESAKINDLETEFNTEKQIEKFGDSIRSIEKKIGYLGQEKRSKVYPKVRTWGVKN